MRRSIARLAGVSALALAVAAFAGAAAAGNGNGNGNESAPGQVKQEQAAQPAQPQQSAPATSSQNTPPGQAKKSSGTSDSSHGVNSTQAGKKPSNSTTKWTHCSTAGGVGASALCAGVQGTPNDQPDVSKRYGNGKTAAQIANSRGAPAGTILTGPGNSQPHKVTACGKPNNKSGGVDVHAVKSYDNAKCQSAASTQQPSVTESRVCGAVITTTHTQKVVGALHGKHEHLMTNPKAAHFTKHADKKVTAESVTKVTATGETCGSAPAQSSASQASMAQVQALPATQGLPATAQAPPATQVQPATQSLPATQGMPAATQAQGAVLGAHASLAQPKSKSKGGVLGVAGNIAGASLPFTGFPLWAAVLIAIALIAAGLMLRRRGPSAPRI
jgi:hypothetical protein